jgi:hypothetical protein
MTTTPKTDRYSNRAPKGGAVSPINGQFYAGGRWMPMTAEVVEVVAKPAPLAGSSRQVAWASRLRREELANLDDEIHARILFLASPIRAEVSANRKAVKPLLIARHRLMSERSAAKVIERRPEMLA